MIDNMRVGRALKTLRKKAGYTQKELADKLFLSKMAISKWENGKSIPDIGVLKRLSVLLDMDVEGLIDGTGTYLDDPWKGVLYLDTPEMINAGTIIFDKPLIDYLVSYFILAGVRNLLIVCTDQDRSYIKNRYGDGDTLGICLRYQPMGILDLDTILLNNEEWFRNSSLMVVPEPFFIYGVDLTRFMQRAMQHKDRVVNLVSVIGSTDAKLSSRVPMEREDQGGLANYCYQSIPLFFLWKDIVPKIGKTEGFDGFISAAVYKNMMRSEPMDKGYLISGFSREDDVRTVSSLVELIQKLCGYIIYCPFEIAWRRGMIDKETTIKNASSFVEYGDYLNSI